LWVAKGSIAKRGGVKEGGCKNRLMGPQYSSNPHDVGETGNGADKNASNAVLSKEPGGGDETN